MYTEMLMKLIFSKELELTLTKVLIFHRITNGVVKRAFFSAKKNF
jgi:hypothetical protein